MMKTEFKSKTLTGLLVLLFGLAALSGCASTGDDCNCDEGDEDCKERCVQDLDI